MWTNTSLPPSSTAMNPKPLSALKNFTRPSTVGPGSPRGANPACAALRTARRGGRQIDRMNGHNLRAALARAQIANHGGALAHFAHTGALERRDMQEGVGRSVGRRNETKALGGIEPLHSRRNIGLFDRRPVKSARGRG